MKFPAIGVIALLSLAVFVSCGDSPDVDTPAAQTPPATATPRPLASPSHDGPPTETPRLTETPRAPTVQIPNRPATIVPDRPTPATGQRPTEEPEDGPTAQTPMAGPEVLLSVLPGDSIAFVFVEVQTVLQRPGLQEELEYEMDTLTNATNGVISEELFRSARVESAAFGTGPEGGSQGAAVLVGDFHEFPATLHQAAAASAAELVHVEVAEIYRDALILRVSADIPYPEANYLAIIPSDNVAISPDLGFVKTQVDLYRDDDPATEPRSHSAGLRNLIRAVQSPEAIEPYRGVEIYVFADYSDLYLALTDDRTMLLARGDETSGHDSLKEIIDRRLDGGELPEPLHHLLAETGPVDFMIARSMETGGSDQGSQPIALPTFHAFAGAVNEGDTSTVYVYLGFEEEEQAEQAADFLSVLKDSGDYVGFEEAGQATDSLSVREDLGDLFYIYLSETARPSGEIRQAGRAVIAEAVAPDVDVSDLFLSD